MATTNANIEVKLNKSDPNVCMQFTDQDQLMQITQLINNLNNQQTLNPVNSNQQLQQGQATFDTTTNDFNFQFQNLFDQESTTSNAQTNLNQVGTQVISPAKFDFSQASQIQSSNHIFNQLQQNDQHQSEYHPIMLNGQPALFIPASSAISSNLLSQMMMTNQFETLNSVENTIEQPSQGFQQTQNPQIMDTLTNNITPTNIPNNTNNIMNEIKNESNINNSSAPNFVNVAGDTNNIEINLANVFGNLENLTQNQMIVNDNQGTNNVNQQLICINQDGNITFQQVPLIAPQNQPEFTDSTNNITLPVTKQTKKKIQSNTNKVPKNLLKLAT